MSQITLKPLDDGQKAVVIPVGKTTIGRGSLPGCSDKKVSRNHAVLEVTSKGEVYLTPTHVNPCFYQPSADNPGQILKKDVPHKLENGDSFSLLPRAYRYQLSVVDKAEQNDLTKGKTNGSTGDVLEDDHKEPTKGSSNVEPTDTIAADKPNAKPESPSDKKPAKEDANSLPKRPSPDVPSEDKKEKEPSPPKENNVLHKESAKEDKEEPKAFDDSSPKGSNHLEEEEEAQDDEEEESFEEKGRKEKEEVRSEEEPKKESSSEEKKEQEGGVEDKAVESCEESRDEGTLDTLPSKVSEEEEEEEESKPAKRGGRKKAAKPPPAEKNVAAKRKGTGSGTRGRKKKTSQFDFGPGEEGNSSQRVAGRTSSRTNRQTRQGLSLEDFIVSDDDEWQSDHSSPRKRRKKRGSRRNDDSGSDWETEHKKPKKSIGAKGGSGSESGSDWGTPKKKGGPKGKRRKGKTPESEEVVSEGEPDPGPSSSTVPKERIPCTYGKKCYRRNQNHVEQFSHPGDSDYASDAEADQKSEEVVETESVKKECPYGANCFRKNAQHKRDFKHTKKVRPQRAATDKKAKGGKSSEEVDSYDLNDSLLNDDSADEYKPVDSGSDYESGERSKKLAKAKVAARGGKRGRRA